MIDLLHDFDPVSLDELDRRARLMRRTDNKYVLNTQQLAQLSMANNIDPLAVINFDPP